MTVQVFYQRALWLPLAVPALVFGIVNGLLQVGIRLPGEIRGWVGWLGYSVIFGAVPYTLLALWATWWVERRNEEQIQRMMLRSPFVMAITFAIVALIAFQLRGAPLEVTVATAVLGAVMSIPFGYAYVAVVILLRRLLASRIG